jgi:hypothetical protein
MALPASFERQGFVSPFMTRHKINLGTVQKPIWLKPLLVGQEGMTDCGKTEFALSIPGVIQMLSVDRNFQGVFDNPHPPAHRNPNIGIKVIQPPLQGQAKTADYGEYYKLIRASFYEALESKDSTCVFLDGDSDFWEIHILGYFGKTTQIYPQTRYAAPYADKRAQIAKAWDSGKIVFFSNKVKDSYETVYKADGTPEKDPVNGEDMRRKTGGKERQGFKDQDYLWDMQISHMFRPARTQKMGSRTIQVPMEWGVKILKCKHDMEKVGAELWGENCNFRGLVDLVYPEVPLERWGFKL